MCDSDEDEEESRRIRRSEEDEEKMNEHFSSSDQNLFATSPQQNLRGGMNNSDIDGQDFADFGDMQGPVTQIESGEHNVESSVVQTACATVDIKEIHDETIDDKWDDDVEIEEGNEKDSPSAKVLSCSEEKSEVADPISLNDDGENGWADFATTAETQFVSSQPKQTSEECAIDSESNERENAMSDDDDDFADFGTFEQTVETENDNNASERYDVVVSGTNAEQDLPQLSDSAALVQDNSQTTESVIESAGKQEASFANFSSATGEDSDWADFGGAGSSTGGNESAWPSAFSNISQPLEQIHTNEEVTSLEDSFDDFGDAVGAATSLDKDETTLEGQPSQIENHVAPFNQSGDVIETNEDDDFEDFADFSTGPANESSAENVQMNGYAWSSAGQDHVTSAPVSTKPITSSGIEDESNASHRSYSYVCIEDLLDEIDLKATATKSSVYDDSLLISEEPLLLQDFFASMSIASHISKQISEEVELAWTLVANLCNSSSLLFDCEDSVLNQQLLASLGVDISNAEQEMPIELHRSRSGKLSAVKQNLPKYAAQLGLLQPVKSGSSSDSSSNLATSSSGSGSTGGVGGGGEGGSDRQRLMMNSQFKTGSAAASGADKDSLSKCQPPTPDAVPDAEFDWGTSGLKNPLEIPSLSLDFFDSQFNSSSAASASSQLEEELLNALGAGDDAMGGGGGSDWQSIGGGGASSTTSSGSRRTIPGAGGNGNKSSNSSSKDSNSRLASILAAAQSSTAQESVNNQLSAEAGRVVNALPKLSFMLSKVLMFPFLTDRINTSNGPPGVPGSNSPLHSGTSLVHATYIQAPQYDTHHSPHHPEVEEEEDDDDVDDEEVDEQDEVEGQVAEQECEQTEATQMNETVSSELPQDSNNIATTISCSEEMSTSLNTAQ